MSRLFLWLLLLTAALVTALAEPSGVLQVPTLDHMTLNLDEQAVDIEVSFCKPTDKLELILCTDKGRVHESLLSTQARPQDIHIMLLLLGAQAGNPHYERPPTAAGESWVLVAAQGARITATLVLPDAPQEYPLGAFLQHSDGQTGFTEDFLFAGSRLRADQQGGAAHYLANYSGNIISLSSFDDEVLCLEQFTSQENTLLEWIAHMPAEHTPVPQTALLRLRRANQ